jgi:hypothetical protein
MSSWEDNASVVELSMLSANPVPSAMARLLKEVDFSLSEVLFLLNPGGGGVREVRLGPSSEMDSPARLRLPELCAMVHEVEFAQVSIISNSSELEFC